MTKFYCLEKCFLCYKTGLVLVVLSPMVTLKYFHFFFAGLIIIFPILIYALVACLRFLMKWTKTYLISSNYTLCFAFYFFTFFNIDQSLSRFFLSDFLCVSNRILSMKLILVHWFCWISKKSALYYMYPNEKSYKLCGTSANVNIGFNLAVLK